MIGFENGIRWMKCVQGAPGPYWATGAEMKGRGKPKTVWPTRWKALNKNDQETAYPPSTWVQVPAVIKKDGDGCSQRKWRGFSARLDTQGRILLD